MKILHVIKELETGGIQSQLLHLCRFSVGQKEAKIHLAAIGDGNLLEDFKNAGVVFHHFPVNKYFWDFKTLWQLRQLIKKEQFDFVHCHYVEEAFYVYFASLGLSCKKALSFHVDMDVISTKDQKKFKYIAPKFDLNITVSNTFKKHLAAKGFQTDTFETVYNGVPILAEENQKENDLKSALKLPENAVLMVMIGGFYFGIRNQLFVCKALKNFLPKYKNVHFAFVGGRSYRKNEVNKTYYDECYEYCKENDLLHQIHFLGRRNDVNTWIGNVDAHIYCSEKDTFGMAVFESVFAGIPTFVNNHPLFKEVTNNGELAFIYDYNQYEFLTEKITSFLEKMDKHKSLAKKMSEKAKSTYSVNNQWNRLMELYQKQLAN